MMDMIVDEAFSRALTSLAKEGDFSLTEPIASLAGGDLQLNGKRFENALQARSDALNPGTVSKPANVFMQAGQQLGDDWNQAKAISTKAFTEPLDLNTLLTYQMSVKEATLRNELAAKLVQKTAQSVDQLVRIQ